MQIKVLGAVYPVPTRPLELGEQRRLKREFGFVPGRDEMDLTDPDHVAAFIYWTMRAHNPDAPVNAIMKSIERVREVEFLDDDGNALQEAEEIEAAGSDDEEDPTPPRAPVAKRGK